MSNCFVFVLQVKELNSRIVDQKSALAPVIKELRSLRQTCQVSRIHTHTPVKVRKIIFFTWMISTIDCCYLVADSRSDLGWLKSYGLHFSNCLTFVASCPGSMKNNSHTNKCTMGKPPRITELNQRIRFSYASSQNHSCVSQRNVCYWRAAARRHK